MTSIDDKKLSDLVWPIGKYKGTPIEIVLADQNYVNWVTSQPFFEEKYPVVYNAINNITNNVVVGESETPEHNAIQARFLNDEFLVKIHQKVYPESKISPSEEDFVALIKAFEVYGWDVQIGRHFFEIKPIVGDDYPSVLRQMKSNVELLRRNSIKLPQMRHNYWEYVYCLYTTKIETKLVKSEDVIKVFSLSGFKVIVDEE